ncbi:phospholipid/cholesterol/gamma-HCH transport system ATP-binding protein [Pseudidiomarina planktonica]|uniref:Phospholipid/cholesterol/gamma-HCH transport system ATP-binding protein n=1 Tax=Pseudidiomarina planktonica TaxID=1323738 RepID=A0A1Y6EH95_9GAMM|nr:phospholipid ABC transporter ATP-binding protein MlaF [Pseudidiomarina planktonica]RUO66092.1 phospholipid ABC transporter ATP-binding protein MlaF [Pseudidiomarina planktonica]SMQ60531.1 phospholipid/cholesterol/gamma-HCH transport system ATP-binding protein [Pseudidiomarina planktonica]
METLVEIDDVKFSHGERLLYDGLSLTVPRGKIVAVMGPSGIGKTTLLRLIGGQIRPQQGSIKVAGHNIPTLSRSDLYQVRKRISMLFQSGALFTDMTVFDNVAFPLREHSKLPESIIRTIVLMKLEAVGLRGARDLFPAELSGGMARRAALARAIALDPELIMYDEPFAGQDPISMGVIVKLIRELSSSLGLTSIIVSHDVKEVMSIADYAYIIANKKVVAKGTPKELDENASGIVKQFMRGEADGPVPFHYEADDYFDDLLEGSK